GNGTNRSSRPMRAALAGPPATEDFDLPLLSFPLLSLPLLCLPFGGSVVVVVVVVVDDELGVPTPPGTGTVVTVVVGTGDVVVVVLASGPVVVVVPPGWVVVVDSTGWPVGPVPSDGGGAIGLAASEGSAARSVAVPRPTSTSSIQVRPGRRRAYLPSSPRNSVTSSLSRLIQWTGVR